MIKRLLVAATLAAIPSTVLACPNCYASLGSRLLHTYYLSTIFLSLLPLAVIVTLVAVGRNMRRRFRDLPVQESCPQQR